MGRTRQDMQELISRYVDGEVTFEERAQAERWLREPEAKAYYDDLMCLNHALKRVGRLRLHHLIGNNALNGRLPHSGVVPSKRPAGE